MKNDGLILLGGGLDSTALLVYLAKAPFRLPLRGFFVDYGQKAASGEMRSVCHFCKKYNVPLTTTKISLHELSNSTILAGQGVAKEQSENVLEGRNVILVMMAATYACSIGVTELFVGFHKEPDDSPFRDAKDAARVKMNELISVAYKNGPTLLAPFAKLTRLEILKMGLRMDGELATRTFTCYEGNWGECGECVHCRKKQEMLKQLTLEKQDASTDRHNITGS